MANRNETVELSWEELREFGQLCAAEACSNQLETLKDALPALEAQMDVLAMSELDRVPEHIVLSFFDVSRATLVESWEVPRAGKQGNTPMYDPEEVLRYVAEEESTETRE
jgi:hypothetical protein